MSTQTPALARRRSVPAGAHRLVRALTVALVAWAATGSFCPETQSAGQGNLDRPGGVVVYAVGDSHYAVLPQPQARHLRVFDLDQRLFVAAPNVYFPLSIPAGPYTQRIVVDTAHALALALDSADGGLRALRIGPPSDENALKRIGEVVPAGLSPVGLATDPASADPRIWVADAAAGSVHEFELAGDVSSFALGRSWPIGGEITDLAYDAASGVLFVADATGDALQLITVADGALQTLSVAGPVGRLMLVDGYLSSSESQVPLLLAMRRDRTAVVLVRPGATPEVLSAIEFPAMPVAAVALDSARLGDTVCSGLVDPPCGYLAVLTIDGILYYVDLTTVDASGQPLPRIFDEIETGPSLSSDPNTDPTLYDPNSADPDALLRRPRVDVQPLEIAEAPRLVQQRGDASYLFTYQGIAVPLRDRHGRYDLATQVFSDDDSAVDLAELGARAGDLLDVPAQDHCGDGVRLAISDVSGCTLHLADADSARDCIGQVAGVVFNVRAGDQFTVALQREDLASGILGRVAFGEPFLARVVSITLSEAVDAGGAALGPPATGAVLNVPIEDNFDPLGLDLGIYGAVPTGIAVAPAGTGDNREWQLLVSAAGGSSLFLLDPGVQGYIGTDYMPIGVARYQ
ncbi:MAG: hypothetical protein JXR83_08850 [Deltaproteobacteria bacterium]|nr:hypothetical protein [Deltaproteobacteria bacterium]